MNDSNDKFDKWLKEHRPLPQGEVHPQLQERIFRSISEETRGWLFSPQRAGIFFIFVLVSSFWIFHNQSIQTPISLAPQEISEDNISLVFDLSEDDEAEEFEEINTLVSL